MPTLTTAPRVASFTDVEILDFGPMRDDAVNHFCSLKPERAEWDDEYKKRIVITTECKWGRVEEGGEVFMLSELGQGPRKPLSGRVTCRVALLASMPGTDGWMETTPFAKVEINDTHARELPSIGRIKLEQFISTRLPEYEKTYNEYRETFMAFREKAKARRAARMAEREKAAPQTGVARTEVVEEAAPPIAEGAPPMRQKPPQGGKVSM